MVGVVATLLSGSLRLPTACYAPINAAHDCRLPLAASTGTVGRALPRDRTEAYFCSRATCFTTSDSCHFARKT
jgi:hypothetical protein